MALSEHPDRIRFMQREPSHKRNPEDRRFRFLIEPHCQRRNKNGKQ